MPSQIAAAYTYNTKHYRLPKLSGVAPLLLNLPKFKPRAPVHMAAHHAARVGPSALDYAGASEVYTAYRSLLVPLKHRGLTHVDADGLVWAIESVRLEVFGARNLEKPEDPKTFTTFVAQHRLSREEGALVRTLEEKVGLVNEAFFSNQCLLGARVAGQQVHSVEQLFHVAKACEIAELAGETDAPWLKQTLETLLFGCASPRDCQIETGPKGHIPASVFAKIADGWNQVAVERMVQVWITVALEDPPFYARWKSWVDARVASSDVVATHMFEAREEKVGDVWGCGCKDTPERHEQLFQAAELYDYTTTTNGLFSPAAFLLEKGQGLNQFGQAAARFIALLQADATHADFCARAAGLGLRIMMA